MFWKRKNRDKEVFSVDSQDRRSSFRVSPLHQTPIEISFRGRPVHLKDIGALGVAFFNEGFRAGDTEVIDLDLPGETQPFPVKTEVIEIDTENVCHCAFLDLDQESVNAIHRYILKVQIARIRSAKKCISRSPRIEREKNDPLAVKTLPQLLPGK